MKTDIEISNDEPIVTMSRTFAAPRDIIWTVFTEPKHVAKWYGGHGFENPVCEMDVRPGGIWRHTMKTPDGTLFPMEFVYLEVVKPEKLSWKNAKPVIDRTRGKNVTNTITLEDDGPRTKWKLVARFESIEERDHAMSMGFTRVIEQGSEKLAAIATALAGNGGALGANA